MRTFKIIIPVLLLMVLITSCDRSALLDENKVFPDHAWHYRNKPVFDVNIEDTNKTYTVYVNLRVGNEYKYSNFFVMLHQTSPSHQVTKERKELTLLDESGKWLGKGLGDLFDYQIPVYNRMRFREKGIYRFELEQNMREDTLMNIYSAGLRIEDFSKAHNN